MPNSLFVPVTGIVQNVRSFSNDCCQQILSLSGTNGITNFIISRNTYIAEQVRFVPGMRITAFYDANAPVPLIFPPQYQAVAAGAVAADETMAFDYFSSNLVSSDNSLQLNLTRATEVTTANGQSFSCRPAGYYLIVFYGASTRSIPAQTTPRKIIVMC